jgi:hypothetical protein
LLGAWVFQGITMFIGKTIIDKQAVLSLGSQLYNTKRTHENDLVALQYMVSDDISEYDAIRGNEFTSLIKYTFCWVIRPEMYHKYISPTLEIELKRIVNEDNYTAYVCFFTASIGAWIDYWFDKTKPPDLRSEVKQCLSKDGYSLLFKEDKLIK